MRLCAFFFSSRRRHTRSLCDWSSDVCSSDLEAAVGRVEEEEQVAGRGLVAEIRPGELQCLAQSLLRRTRDEVRRVNAFVQPLPSVLPYPALRCPAATEFERLFVGERRESAGLHRRAEFRAQAQELFISFRRNLADDSNRAALD